MVWKMYKFNICYEEMQFIFPFTVLTYDNEADNDKDGGTSYYEDLKKEVSLQGQVSFHFCLL